jgi:hypothetical protein
MLLQIKGLQMLIDEEKSNCKMMIGILSTLSDKTLNEWKIIRRTLLLSNHFFSAESD